MGFIDKNKVIAKIKQFDTALTTLNEAVTTAKSDLEKDGTIQRFEYCFELSWKVLKVVLEYEGIDSQYISSPRNVFKEAIKQGYIENEEFWVSLIELRNLTVHTYDATTSKEIFEKLKVVYVAMIALEYKLKFNYSV